MSKIINFTDSINKKKTKSIKCNLQCTTQKINKYIDAWDKLSSQQKKIMQELLEN